MTAYADSSFLVSLYGRDSNSHRAIALANQHQPAFLVTPLGEAEFINTVQALVFRPRGWKASEAEAVRDLFRQHLRSGILRFEDFRPGIWDRAIEISLGHTARAGCRILDILHVASALVLRAEMFLTFDKQQWTLARELGLRVLPARL